LYYFFHEERCPLGFVEDEVFEGMEIYCHSPHSGSLPVGERGFSLSSLRRGLG
jgi:hypothetical protein